MNSHLKGCGLLFSGFFGFRVEVDLQAPLLGKVPAKSVKV